ncbi:MAG TPA: hypothetical protein VMB52_05425 [Verrucomicrobiae bacterium]|nr:hypothetical protein [Verrucomicrobiae bacterium]
MTAPELPNDQPSPDVSDGIESIVPEELVDVEVTPSSDSDNSASSESSAPSLVASLNPTTEELANILGVPRWVGRLITICAVGPHGAQNRSSHTEHQPTRRSDQMNLRHNEYRVQSEAVGIVRGEAIMVYRALRTRRIHNNRMHRTERAIVRHASTILEVASRRVHREEDAVLRAAAQVVESAERTFAHFY